MTGKWRIFASVRLYSYVSFGQSARAAPSSCHRNNQNKLQTMNTIPPYKKWFDASGIAPAAAASVLADEESVQPGQIIAFGGDNRSQGPPTNGESFSLSAQVFVPMGVNEQGMPTPIHAQLQLTYTVEDWGTASVDGAMVMNFTTATSAPTGSYGGHTAWGGSRCVPISSGTHSISFTYSNITMPDADMNQIVCVYSYSVVELEPGGKKEPQPCSSCNGSTCSAEGGQETPVSRSVGDFTAAATSSAGSAVAAELTEDSMLWSCNMGTLRGLGALLTGKVQLYANSFDASLATPAALAFNHPMLASLVIPTGGIVPGAKLEIHIGDRVIALRCYTDGSVAPIGVDSAGKGLVSLTTDEAVTSLKWQDNSGAAWVFDGTSGALISYTSPEQVTITDVSDYLIVKRFTEDDSLRQIWSLWDGLLNIEDISDSGYSIRLYTAEHISGTDASGFFIPEPGTAFKTFTVSCNESALTIVEKTPGREDYACTWSMGADGAWSLARGAAEEAVTTSRVCTILEPGSDTDFEVRQQVTTISRGGVTASCVCEIYQDSPMGALLLTRVVGYGTPPRRPPPMNMTAWATCWYRPLPTVTARSTSTTSPGEFSAPLNLGEPGAAPLSRNTVMRTPLLPATQRRSPLSPAGCGSPGAPPSSSSARSHTPTPRPTACAARKYAPRQRVPPTRILK